MEISLQIISMVLVVVAGVTAKSTESYKIAEQSVGLDDGFPIPISGRATTSQLTFYDASKNTYTFVYDGPDCYTLPYEWRNRAILVKTGNKCVHFFKQAGCRGEGFLVDPFNKHRYGTTVDLGGVTKKVVSFRPC